MLCSRCKVNQAEHVGTYKNLLVMLCADCMVRWVNEGNNDDTNKEKGAA